MVGKVKTFNKQKGFGFINCDDSTDDIFFHYTSLVMEGYKTVEVGANVEFDLEVSEKGKRASNIKVLN